MHAPQTTGFVLFTVQEIPDQHFNRVLLQRASQCHYPVVIDDTQSIRIRHLQAPSDVTATHGRDTVTTDTSLANQNTESSASENEQDTTNQNSSETPLDKTERQATSNSVTNQIDDDGSTNSHRHKKGREKSTQHIVGNIKSDKANTSQRDSSHGTKSMVDTAVHDKSQNALDSNRQLSIMSTNSNDIMQDTQLNNTVTSSAHSRAQSDAVSQINAVPLVIFTLVVAQFCSNFILSFIS